MKLKMAAIVILALAAFSWAQTVTPPQASPTQPPTGAAQATSKADCPCCQKMADSKATESRCAHHPDGSAKPEMSCCKGKDAKDAMSCMKGDKDKSADACSNGKCGGDGKEGCCSKSDKTTEQAAMACCGANGDHCGMAHHDHGNIDK